MIRIEKKKTVQQVIHPHISRRRNKRMCNNYKFAHFKSMTRNNKRSGEAH